MVGLGKADTVVRDLYGKSIQRSIEIGERTYLPNTNDDGPKRTVLSLRTRGVVKCI